MTALLRSSVCHVIFAIFLVAALLLVPAADARRFKRQDGSESEGEALPPEETAAAEAATPGADPDAAVPAPSGDSAPSEQAGIVVSDSWIMESIRRINEIRAGHVACPVSLDKNLCEGVQARANEIVASGEIQAQAVAGSGENVYTVQPEKDEDTPKPENAPNAWYEERAKYDYAAGKPKEEGDATAFFTQLVWKDSTGVCVTFEKSAEKDANGENLLAVVAKFSPAGNVEGQFLENVRPEENAGAAAATPTAINSDKCPKAKAQASGEWEETVLKAHNMLRALHGSQALILNNDLSEISQAFANKLADTNHFEHNSACIGAAELGENLYFSSTSNPNDEAANGTRAVMSWYEEIANYDYEATDSKNGMEILHFTQLVWKETREMGGAYAVSTKPNSRGFYSTYVVVNYTPRGNFGNFIANVKPPVCKNVNYAGIGLPISTGSAAGGGGGGGGDALSEPNKNSTSIAFLDRFLNVMVWVTISYYSLMLVDSLP